MKNVRTYFLAFLFLAGGLFAGCGSSDGTIYVPDNNTPIQISTGEVRLLTSLQGVQAQAELSTGDTVPVAVTDFRFTGFDANGTLIFAVVKAKAATVLLSSVPVQVTNIRIELLAGGLPIGGVSVPVAVTAGNTTTIDRPTFTFIDSETFEPDASVFGSFADSSFVGEDGLVDFITALASQGVTRVSPGVYAVSTEGDYLISYNLTALWRQIVFEVFDGQGTLVDDFIFRQNFGSTDPSFSFVVSLDPANGRSRFQLRILDTEEEGTPRVGINGNFSIVRIGPSSGQTLPEIVEEDVNGREE